MIKYIKNGNIFDSKAQILVNPVNCVGVSGAGLAKQFKEKFPDHQKEYKKICLNNNMVPGSPYLAIGLQKEIIYFPTKEHWKDKSQYEYVRKGLCSLFLTLYSKEVKSIAFPKLGCGLGGLDWNIVKPMIEAFAILTNYEVEVYE